MVAKSETAAGRRAALAAGRALPPASPGQPPGYPIRDANHWDKARQAVGRVKNPARRAQLAALLRKTAPMVGRTQALGESWAAAGGSGNAGSYSSYGRDIRALLMAGDGDTDDSGGSMRSSVGGKLQCPNCGYRSDDADFRIEGGTADTTDPAAPETLRTPTGNVSSTIAGMRPEQIGVRGGSPKPAGALSNSGLGGIQLARRTEITSPWDIVVSRSDTGGAIIRHRRGGEKIGEIRKTDEGAWTAVAGNGQALAPHTHQRAALAELIGTHNSGATTMLHRGEPLQPPPVQTRLMEQFGIPAIRLATPSGGASDGGRMTTSSSGGDDSGSPGGLTPKGVAIYKKLLAKGFPAARALTFAKRAQSFGGSK